MKRQQKKRLRNACCLVIIILMIPYVTTLAWSGSISGKEPKKTEISSERMIELDRGLSGTAGQADLVSMEEYLIGIVAKQIPAEYEPEALKAQAIIARTYVMKQMGDQKQIPESALDLDYYEDVQLQKLWGKEHFIEYYQKIESAVSDTKGMVLTYQGELIDPLFHRVSNGKTRQGDKNHPYLQSVEAKEDVEAEDYLSIQNWDKKEFVNIINEIPNTVPISEQDISGTIQLVERDSAGYTKQMQIGSQVYSGEELQAAFSCASPDITMEEYQGKIRGVCRGIGHGYGLSQYNANKKSEQGWTAEEILQYFYQNIVIISE